MASESSSAVLELNDGDTEDTDAPSVTDDVQEGAPLIMEHGHDIAVKVDAPMKQLSTLETFVTYRVRCVCARWPTPPCVRRRYNHFKVLHKRLCQAHPLLAPPPLPPLHSARQQLDRYSPSFVCVRTLALHAFLDRVAKHPILTHSEDFRIFLTTPDDEIDKVFKSENSAMNLWGLSSALYGGGEAKPTNGARVKDPEFTSAADYLQSLQQKLTELCALTSKLYKGGASLGSELMGMKRACDAWATQAGGRTARAAAGCGAGALAAAGAHSRARAPLRHRAALPLMAAYAAAHVDKIRQRDAVHAAHVAGNDADELHNRLEQASEALRSELSDWTPKTQSEIKSLLLDLADRQVGIHTQTLLGWEHALKLSTEPNPEDLFKTVSKTAVQNLSPSKCRVEFTPTETEFDVDNYDDDSDVQELRLHDERSQLDEADVLMDIKYDDGNTEARAGNADLKKSILDSESKSDDWSKIESLSDDGLKIELNSDNGMKIGSNSEIGLKIESVFDNGFKIESNTNKDLKNESMSDVNLESNSDLKLKIDSNSDIASNIETSSEIGLKTDSNKGNGLRIESVSDNGLRIESVSDNGLRIELVSDNGLKIESVSDNGLKIESVSDNGLRIDPKPDVASKLEVISSDPLQNFADVDLSS